VCRDQFIEDATNGMKCVPQYGLMPAYMKKPRKFMNKNNLSYSKNIENSAHDQIPWQHYLLFGALILCKIGYLYSCVVRRRRKMSQKKVTEQELGDETKLQPSANGGEPATPQFESLP